MATKTNKEQPKKEETKKEQPRKQLTALEKAGIAALELNGLEKVWVTGDGQSFDHEGNARNHAENLRDKQIITVTK